MPHSVRGWITYTPSVAGWSNMSIKADAYTAANNGQQLAITPPVNNFWPLHHQDLRCVYGVDNTKAKDSCIATAPSGALFVLGATFTDEFGNVYTVNGMRAERFRIRDLK